MAKAEASVEELVSMVERGELHLPEMQRQYVWRSTRVRDLLDSLYRGYPSGAILLWETDEADASEDELLTRFNKMTFLDFQSTCAQNGFELDLGLHLKNLMAFATGQSRCRVAALCGWRVRACRTGHACSVVGG